MKPEQRFGLDEIARRQQQLADAQKYTPPAKDGMSRLGQALVNLPWLVLGIAFIVWLIRK